MRKAVDGLKGRLPERTCENERRESPDPAQSAVTDR